MLHTGIDLHKGTLLLTTTGDEGRENEQADIRIHRRAVAVYFRRHPGPHRVRKNGYLQTA
ncbi:MAG TPA: hypothetical protein VF188_13085 [Longimicrobiales bacterium]